MSKFCTKCGRPVPEGGICSCQLQAGGQAQTPPNQNSNGSQQGNQPFQGQQQGNQQFQGQQGSQPFQGQQGSQQFQSQPFNGQQYKEQASAFAQNFFGKLLYVIKRPVEAGTNLILEANIKTALLLVAAQGLCSALFAMAAAGKVSGYIQAASGLANGISSGLGNVVAGAMGMPYFRIFLVTVAFSMALSCILALMLLLGHMALKIPVSFQQMLSAAAIRSAVLCPAILLSLVVFELAAPAGIALFLLINIWGFTAMAVTMSNFVHKEKRDMFVLAVSIVNLLFVFAALFVFSKIWTLYLPDLIRAGIKSMGNASMLELIDEFL
ncbi:MAG: hypothetical protein HFH43_04545 [Lachnospiraceae bacterium]|nr:hypothetical protein [Lachnospiraceae bacterium]